MIVTFFQYQEMFKHYFLIYENSCDCRCTVMYPMYCNVLHQDLKIVKLNYCTDASHFLRLTNNLKLVNARSIFASENRDSGIECHALKKSRFPLLLLPGFAAK